MSNTQLQILDKNALNKAGIKSLSDAILVSIEEGTVNPLDLLIMFKAIDQIKEKVKDEMTKAAVDEAAKHGKNFSYFTGEFREMEGGTKFYYGECNHPVYNRLMDEKKELDKKIKEIEEQLKATKTSFTVVDEETGETCTVYPPKKTSTTTIAVTIKD